MSKFKEFWSEEKEKIREMTPRQAAEYIWIYFKIPIIAILFVLIYGSYLIFRIATNIPDNWLMVTFANTTEELGTGSSLWKEFTEAAGYDLSQKKVEFNDESYFDYTKNQARGNAYYNAFITLADTGELDAITMETESLAALGQSGRLMDLSSDRCIDFQEKYEDRFIYYEPAQPDEENPGPIPVGIDISDSILMTQYHIYPDSCAIGIGAFSENLEEVGFFIGYLLGEEESCAN